jgi:hypothetical protein
VYHLYFFLITFFFFIINKLDTSSTTTTTTTTTTAIASSSSSSSSLLLSSSQASSSSSSSSNTANSNNTNTKKTLLRRSTFPYVKVDPVARRYKRIHKDKEASPSNELAETNNVFHREEDVLLCLQLLAYLSKYPHLRDLFHTAYTKNVFSVVEKFCHRLHPGPIQYWAGVIMRNACRKDETRGGIRKCANMSCGKWEQQPREFAKCRRCRKAKYCSKACQSKAWADGHRWWCVERHSSTVRENNSSLAGISSVGTGVHTVIPTATTTNTTTPSTIMNNTSTNDNQQEAENNAETSSSLLSTTENQSTETAATNMLNMELGVHMEL